MSEKAKNEVYRLKTDGFHGELFRPEQDSYPGKALICFSGSDGRFEWIRTLAQIFQSHGLTALALAYVMEEGLPRAFYQECREHCASTVRYMIKGADGLVYHKGWGVYAPAYLRW